MRHTTSLRILEESLLLKCLFNLEENLGSVENVQKSQTSTNLISHGDSIQRVEGCRKLALLEDDFRLTNSQTGNLIQPHKTNYIAGRDLPYKHSVQ